MKRFFKDWDTLDDRVTAISNMVVAITLPIILIIFCAIFINSMNKAIESADEIPLQITSEYVNLTISEAVSAEVDRQLQALNPVRIEFVNAEVPDDFTPLYLPEIPMDAEHQAILFTAMEEYHVGKGFALALIESESTFDINAKALDESATYYGAWQISGVNAERIRNTYGLDITNPEENLVAGCAMLSELITKYSEYGTDYIINAYKGGEGAAAEWYEEGFKLPCCDEITGRAMYYEELLKGDKANG